MFAFQATDNVSFPTSSPHALQPNGSTVEMEKDHEVLPQIIQRLNGFCHLRNIFNTDDSHQHWNCPILCSFGAKFIDFKKCQRLNIALQWEIPVQCMRTSGRLSKEVEMKFGIDRGFLHVKKKLRVCFQEAKTKYHRKYHAKQDFTLKFRFWCWLNLYIIKATYRFL